MENASFHLRRTKQVLLSDAMNHNSLPLLIFLGVLTNARAFVKKDLGISEGELEKASGVKKPFELHNFMTMKMSFFIDGGPNKDDTLVQMAMKCVGGANPIIPAPSVLARAATIRDFVELLVDFNFELSCSSVYDSTNPVKTLDFNVADFSMLDQVTFKGIFKSVFTLSEWPEQAVLWTFSGNTTVQEAIAEGTK